MKHFFNFFTFVVAWLLFPGTVCSANLTVTPVVSTAPLQFVMKVDQIDKLAGLKVVISYNEKQLAFIKADKSAATSSFMHIANGKKQGQVIVVMASAKGISGKDLELFTLEFDPMKKNSETIKPLLTISDCQLMNEGLKEISCSFNGEAKK